MLQNASTVCSHCEEPETLIHAMFECDYNCGVGDLLLSTFKLYDPLITTDAILTLTFNVEDSLLFPLTWTVACVLLYLWNHRTSPNPGRRINTLTKVKGDVVASAQVLGKTKMLNQFKLTNPILETMFPP